MFTMIKLCETNGISAKSLERQVRIQIINNYNSLQETRTPVK